MNILRLSNERQTPSLALAAVLLAVVSAAPLARAQTVTVLHQFSDCTTCAYGGGHALVLKGAHLYGVADGPYDSSAYSMNIPAGGQPSFKTVFKFPGGTGGVFGPTSALISDAQGNLYGAMKNGGASAGGAVFELSPPAKGQTAWTETLIYSIANPVSNGFEIENGLAIDSSGALYGATQSGGASNCGTVFKLTPPSGGGAWTSTTLHSFTYSVDGCLARGNLLLDAAGNIYGTTQDGGAYNYGTVYTLAPPAAGQTAWTLTTLYQFFGGTDGAQPNGGLLGGAGDLWGTTVTGGEGTEECVYTCGTVFELSRQVLGDPTYTLTTWHAFAGGADGNGPRAGLYLDANGTFWGTTQQGGTPGLGTIYKLALDPVRFTYEYSQVYAFKGVLQGDPANPGCTLVEDSSGALYGTTPAGKDEGSGMIFKLVP